MPHCLSQNSFNPFIPTRGVGIIVHQHHHFQYQYVSIHLYLQEALELLYQCQTSNPDNVSIHLYLQEALECDVSSAILSPFAVSIHLYLQEALELLRLLCVIPFPFRFNPFIPTRGVGIFLRQHFRLRFILFQSIYTYKRRWNTWTREA